ncbi:Alpha beta hydrolase fold protein [Rutstroemia sp. NJR-2017a BVV2]|nr:Alpha beta hydrolase fold protein [Rutstroemia sp. NJR-2017a BVV2]
MISRLSPDPRLHDGITSTYTRNQITHLLTTYYQFLSTLPLIEANDIVYPPPTGWVNLADSTLPFLRKSDEVISLLQHLPYIRKNGVAPYPISPDTFCLDYSSEDLLVPAKINSHEALMSVTKSIPEWVVPLTYPEDSNAGVWWLLDTSDGTVTDWGRHGFESDHNYTEDDPRRWRNECDRTLRLEELLEEWTEKFEKLEWIAFQGHGWVYMWYLPKEGANVESSEDVRECIAMQKIIRDYGWPDNFRRNECKQALFEWEKGTLYHHRS